MSTDSTHSAMPWNDSLASADTHGQNAGPAMTGSELPNGMISLLDDQGNIASLWNIHSAAVTIGSSSLSDVSLSGTDLSPQHASVSFGKNHTLIQSIEGPIRIGGRSIHEWLIDEPTVIQLGTYKFEVTPPAFVKKATQLLSQATARLDQHARPSRTNARKLQSAESIPMPKHLQNEISLPSIAELDKTRMHDDTVAASLTIEKITSAITSAIQSTAIAQPTSSNIDVQQIIQPLNSTLEAIRMSVDGLKELSTHLAGQYEQRLADTSTIIDDRIARIETLLETNLSQITSSGASQTSLSANATSIETASVSNNKFASEFERSETSLPSGPYDAIIENVSNRSSNDELYYPEVDERQPLYSAIQPSEIGTAWQVETSSANDIFTGSAPTRNEFQILQPIFEPAKDNFDVSEQLNTPEISYRPSASVDQPTFQHPSRTASPISSVEHAVEFDRPHSKFDSGFASSHASESILDIGGPAEAEPRPASISGPLNIHHELPAWFTASPSRMTSESTSTSDFSSSTRSFDLSERSDRVAVENSVDIEPAASMDGHRMSEAIFSQTNSSLPSDVDYEARLNLYGERNAYLHHASSEEATGLSYFENTEDVLLEENQPVESLEQVVTAEVSLASESDDDELSKNSSASIHTDETSDYSTYEIDEAALIEAEEEIDVDIEDAITSQPVADEEESIEDYMQRLLQRVKGAKLEPEASEPHRSGKTTSGPRTTSSTRRGNTTSRTKSAANGVGDSTTTSIKTADQNAKAGTVADGNSGTVKVALQRPVHLPPKPTVEEQQKSLAALRDLANSTARKAIQTSTTKRISSYRAGKVGIAATGFVAGSFLLISNGIGLNVTTAGMMCSYAVFFVWGYDAWAQHIRLSDAKKEGKVEKPE